MSTLRTRLRAGTEVLGAFVFLPSPAVVEILAGAGFDFVIIDQEHSPKNQETVEHMVRAAEARGIDALVRVQANEPTPILQALETGASGVVVPFIRGRDDVLRARAAMHYPPRGVRGLCTQTRAARYGALRAGFADFAAARSEELVLIGLIEDPAGVQRIADIVAVEDGLDAALIGRGDLAATLGQLGRTDHPAVREAVHGAIEAIVQAGHPVPAAPSSATASVGAVRAGMTVFGAEECAAWRALGCSVFVAASEASLFLTAGRQWAAAARLGAGSYPPTR